MRLAKIPALAAFLVAVLVSPLRSADDVQIRTLSTRPEMVSGGDVLVAVTSAQSPTVKLNDQDVTKAFRLDAETKSYNGLLTGLRLGSSTLAVYTKGGGAGKPAAQLTLTNHAITGPIFSGPHQSPLVCETEKFAVPSLGLTGLGAPLDANCSIATRIDYVYRSTDGMFKPLPSPTSRPADLAQTTTTAGRTMPYIVRLEMGTINRAIYQLAMLYDPSVDGAAGPLTRPAGWNGKLIYSFGGGCQAGYHQGATANALNDSWLSLGYAAAASSLNVFGTSCADVLSAETMMMVKERFIEAYGVPRYTIGSGASGGSMQQHLIAQNYPGLLDGIQPSSSFPDSLSFLFPATDCLLLDDVFKTSALSWTEEQKTAVAGFRTWGVCATTTGSRLGFYGNRVDPKACAASIPPASVFDPTSNPNGARCTYQDNMVNVYGRDPRTGYARRPYDNVGVQYGLKAFMAGKISAEQFVELNERAAGYDINGRRTSERMVADVEALRRAYQTGRVTGAGGLATIPIIDFRVYRDDISDVHDAVRSHIMRARLTAANGNAANQVILTTANTPATNTALTAQSLKMMDLWLDNISRDTRPGSAAEKIARNKPADLVDACFTPAGERITDLNKCTELYPLFANPRIAAGEPLKQDVLKCQLRPIDAGSYPALSAKQLERLKGAFPTGVCDYSKPGIQQSTLAGTWLAYPMPEDQTSRR